MTTPNPDDFLAEGSDFFSLSKLMGSRIVDIIGYPVALPIEGVVFKLSKIVFENGTTLWVEALSELAYLRSTEQGVALDEPGLFALMTEAEQQQYKAEEACVQQLVE